MPYQVALLERSVARADLQHGVDYISGYEQRGSSFFDPKLVVAHHDASSIKSGNNGALNMIIHGGRDFPGPYGNFQLCRNGFLWVVAAGRANHAGSGSWKGYSGNSTAWGIEAANNGIGEPWSSEMLDTYYRLVKGLLLELAQPTIMVCGHREWTSRKPDPNISSPDINMDTFRANVDSTGSVTVTEGEDEMWYKFFNPSGTNQIWAVSGGGYGFHVGPTLYKEMQNGPAMESNVVHRVSQAQVEKLTGGRFKAAA